MGQTMRDAILRLALYDPLIGVCVRHWEYKHWTWEQALSAAVDATEKELTRIAQEIETYPSPANGMKLATPTQCVEFFIKQMSESDLNERLLRLTEIKKFYQESWITLTSLYPKPITIDGVTIVFNHPLADAIALPPSPTRSH